MARRIAEAKRPPRHGPQAAPFHKMLRGVVAELQAFGRTQADVADMLRIAPKTLECWLSEPAATWHREPHYLVQRGALNVLGTLLYTLRMRADRKR